MNRSAEELAQEGVLLGEELRARNEEASLTAKNQIYDSLTREVQAQIQLVKRLCQTQAPQEDREAGLRQLILLGTYIKRRCNLRLTEQETGRIENEDLRMSFADMISAIRLLGMEGTLEWSSASNYSPRFGMAAFDALETLLERIHFSARSFSIYATDQAIVFSVAGVPFDTALLGGLDAAWETTDEGFRLVLKEEGV